MYYSAQQLAASLMNLLEQNDFDEKIVDKFLKFCTDKKLNHLLPSVLRSIKNMLAQTQSENTLKIYTHQKIDDDTIKKIIKLVDIDKKDSNEELLDNNIIGGFRAEYKNKVYDATINNNLSRLKKELQN